MPLFRKTITLVFCLVVAHAAQGQCPAGTIVTVTSNAGNNANGTFAWALDCLDNAGSTLTTVRFDLNGATEIQPTAVNPLVVNKAGALIDGTNLGSGGPVVIDGSSVAGPAANGLIIAQQNVTVQALTFRDFTSSSGGNGILINTNGATVQNNTSIQNRIGIATGSAVFNATISGNTVGTVGEGNTSHGISIAGAPTAVVITDNDISGNSGAGINIVSGTVLMSNNSIFCNNVSGITRPLPPDLPVISVATNQFVRGTAAAGRVIEVFLYSTVGCAGTPVQGRTLLGVVTTPATGVWNLPVAPGALVAGNQVTATSTQNGNNTSAFAVPATVSDCALSATVSTTNISCAGANNGAATALPNNPSLIYAWSNGSNTANITGLSPDTYTVTITDASGCTATETATITQPLALTVSLVQTNVTCFGGANGSVSSVVNGGVANYTFSWSHGPVTGNVTTLSAGVYTVTVSDQNSCTTTSSSTITQPALLGVNVIATPETAAGTGGTATANAGGGVGGYTYLWQTGATTMQLTDLVAGTYGVTVTDQNGCSVAGSAMVQPFGSTCAVLPVYALLAPAAVCGNAVFTLEADDLYPDPSVTYVWLLPNGDSMFTTQPNLTLTALSSALQGVYFVQRDSAGCRSIAVGGAPVLILSVDNLSAGADQVVCGPSTVTLNATTPTIGVGIWQSLGAATVANPSNTTTMVQGLQTGANTFVWLVSLGNCPQAGADTVVVFLENRPLVRDDRYTLQQANDIAVMEVLLNDALAGIADTQLIQINSPAVGNLELLAQTRRFRYTAPDDFRGIVTFDYAVCHPASQCNLPCDTATVTIDVQNLPTVPTGLVVKDPGANGALTIKGIDGFTRVAITITNRWGDLVFQESDYDNSNPWAGTFKRTGQYLPGGAYYYFLKSYDGNEQAGTTLTGVIHLFDQP